MDNLIFTQSFGKKFVRKGDEIDHCPKAIWEQFFSPKETRISTDKEVFRKGRFFETLAIGGGANPKEDVYDLPRLLNGKKSSDQIRIEEQAMVFKSKLKEFNMKILETQLKFQVEWPYDRRVLVQPTIDFVSPIIGQYNGVKYDYKYAIFDLKLTQNIRSGFGMYAWANPQDMDHLQAFTYVWAFKEATGREVPFFYWVFDYKKNPEDVMIKKKVDDMNYNEMHETIRKTVAYWDYYNKTGWDANPTPELCRNCHLKELCAHSCTAANAIQEI